MPADIRLPVENFYNIELLGTKGMVSEAIERINKAEDEFKLLVRRKGKYSRRQWTAEACAEEAAAILKTYLTAETAMKEIGKSGQWHSHEGDQRTLEFNPAKRKHPGR